MAAASSCCCHGCCWLLPLLLPLLLLPAAAAAAGALGAERASGSLLLQLDVESLLPSAAASCLTPQEQKHGATTATRMPVVHQHGPCSPLADKHGKAPSHTEILAADQRRVEYIHRRVSETTGRARRKRSAPPVELQPGTPSPSSSSSSSLSSSATSSTNLPASSGLALRTGNYVVPIRLGTPAARFTVVFDTGSDTTWVQCQPCVVHCYRQKEPLFNPTRSATYANISCASPYCDELYTSGCSGGHCLYSIQYGDGSTTVGFYAQDTLTLGSSDTVREFRFGCGEQNSGLFGRTAGLMGLGRGKTSLPVQAYDKYGGVFAYCLPATSAGTGFLDLGPGAPAANARLTPMLVDDGPTFYYVGMTGIKVDGRLLPIPGSVFSTAGALVDSGTVITRLPPSAYGPLRSAFARAMDALGYKAAPAFSILDTCYDLTAYQGGSAAPLPAVSLVFQGGACLDVDVSGILYVADVSQACLAFAPNDDDTEVAIVGNTQQKTYSVLYDIGKKVVGFAPGAC